MKHILLCSSCKTYTMQETCPACGGTALSPKPPKFSPADPHGRARRLAKKEELLKI